MISRDSQNWPDSEVHSIEEPTRKAVTRLMGSAPTIERITRLVSEFYCCPKTLQQMPEDVYAVVNSDGSILESARVRKAKNRFRFELVSR